MSFTSTSSISSTEAAPLTLSESFRIFDEDMKRKRAPLQIINPKTGAPIEAYTAYVAQLAATKEAEKAALEAYVKRKPVVVTITAPPTPFFTRWATPAESSAAAKAARAKASELSAQAQRRRAAFAAIERAQDERRAREAAEAEKEEEENAALMKLLGCE